MNSSSPRSSVLRRAIIGATSLAAISLLVAGCSGAPGAGPSEAYTPPEKDLQAEITYAFWDATQQDAIQANVDAFNEEYPNITVNLDVTPWEGYWTKVQTQASSNTLPDL